MSLSKPAKSKISESPSVIHLEEDDTEDRPAHRDQRFKIKFDTTLTAFRGRPEENIGDWFTL